MLITAVEENMMQMVRSRKRRSTQEKRRKKKPAKYLEAFGNGAKRTKDMQPNDDYSFKSKPDGVNNTSWELTIEI